MKKDIRDTLQNGRGVESIKDVCAIDNLEHKLRKNNCFSELANIYTIVAIR